MTRSPNHSLLHRSLLRVLHLLVAGAGLSAAATAQQSVYPDMPEGSPPAVEVENSTAATPAEMKPYREVIVGTRITFSMTPIPGGKFAMGSPEDEADRGKGEGPVHEVEVLPFWMGTHEVSWDEYQLFMLKIDIERRKAASHKPAPQDAWADAVSRPTPPYVPMDFEMGVSGYPAVCMTQFAARQYTRWLSMKTGRFYRLPTEAEWEYACRAGTTTAYSFGDDPGELDDHAWHFENADDQYQKIGTRKPNPWGLHDMHGNVAEWVIDAYFEDGYSRFEAELTQAPLVWPTELYPRVVRGGSWDQDAEELRSAARARSRKSWKVQDPQLPKSIWYHTDATFVGMRVVRPLVEPSAEEQARFWDPDVESVREIMEKQRTGGR